MNKYSIVIKKLAVITFYDKLRNNSSLTNIIKKYFLIVNSDKIKKKNLEKIKKKYLFLYFDKKKSIFYKFSIIFNLILKIDLQKKIVFGSNEKDYYNFFFYEFNDPLSYSFKSRLKTLLKKNVEFFNSIKTSKFLFITLK